MKWSEHRAMVGTIWCANNDDTVVVLENDAGGFDVMENGKFHHASFTFDGAVYHAERLIRIHYPNLYHTTGEARWTWTIER